MSRRILVNQLESARENFCGIGTRAVKLKLNRLGRSCATARAFRLALEIEDKSTQAKKYFGDWKYRCYEEKHKLIGDLIRVCETEGWFYGSHDSNDYQTKHVIYFHLPGCEQISFHCDLTKTVPVYSGEWDGKRNSPLAKIEDGVKKYFDLEKPKLLSIA